MDIMPDDYATVHRLTEHAPSNFLFDPVHLEKHLAGPHADPSALHLLRSMLEKLYKHELRFRAVPLTQLASVLTRKIDSGAEYVIDDSEQQEMRQELQHVRNMMYCIVKICADLNWNPTVICDNDIVPAHLCVLLIDLLACYFGRQNVLDSDQFIDGNNICDMGDYFACMLNGNVASPTLSPVSLFIAQFCARCLLRLRIVGACPPFFPKGTFVHVSGVTDAELVLPSGTTHTRQQQGGAMAAAPVSEAEDAKAYNIVERLIVHNVGPWIQALESCEQHAMETESASKLSMQILTREALKVVWPITGKTGAPFAMAASNINWEFCTEISPPWDTLRCLTAIDFIDLLLLDAEFSRARLLFCEIFTQQRLSNISTYFSLYINDAVSKMAAIFSNVSMMSGTRLSAESSLLSDYSSPVYNESVEPLYNLPTPLTAESNVVKQYFAALDARVAGVAALGRVTELPHVDDTTFSQGEFELTMQLVDTKNVRVFQETYHKLNDMLAVIPSAAAAATVHEHFQKIINYIPLVLRASLDKELEKLVHKRLALLLLGKAFHCMLSRDALLMQKAVDFFNAAHDVCRTVLSESRRKVLQYYQTHAELLSFSQQINSIGDPTLQHNNALALPHSAALTAELLAWREREREIKQKIHFTIVDRTLNGKAGGAVPPELLFSCAFVSYNMQNFALLATIERSFPREDFTQLISMLSRCEQEFVAALNDRGSFVELSRANSSIDAGSLKERAALTRLWLTICQAFSGQQQFAANMYPEAIRPISGVLPSVINDLVLLTRSPCISLLLTSSLAQLWSLAVGSSGSGGSQNRFISQPVARLWPNRIEINEVVDLPQLEQVFESALQRALSLNVTVHNTAALPSRSAAADCFVRELLEIKRDYAVARGDIRACAQTCIELAQIESISGFADVLAAAPFHVATLRRLVLCCEELKYFTHVALLAQYLFMCCVRCAERKSENPEGTDVTAAAAASEFAEVDDQSVREMRALAVRALQERSTNDACDELYEFFFDIDMLEMLAHNLFQRNESEKKLKAIRVIGNPTINVNNDPEFLMWERMKLLRRYLRLLVHEFKQQERGL